MVKIFEYEGLVRTAKSNIEDATIRIEQELGGRGESSIISITLLLLLLTGTIFSYFCMSSITSVLILAILIAIVLF